jgi:hypothetical protein
MFSYVVKKVFFQPDNELMFYQVLFVPSLKIRFEIFDF